MYKSFEGHTSFVISVSFSPDGKYIASGSWDKTIKLWNVKLGNCIKTLEGHTNIVNSVAFSHDGKILASISSDGTSKLWKVRSGKCLKTGRATGYTIWHISSVCSQSNLYIGSGALSPNGRYLADTGRSIKIYVYVPLQELIDKTRVRFKNNPLTAEERREYYLE